MTQLLGKVTTAVIVAVAAVLVAWFIASAATGATLITFRTGSMAPSMPQGAMAITLPVAAKDLHEGDVVTVPRGNDPLPVTHRVVKVDEVSPTQHATPGTRVLTLKGDANKTPDADTYSVATAHRVIFAVPGLGTALMFVQSPIGMGLLTVLVATLMFWAFWPGRSKTSEEVESSEEVETRSRTPKHADSNTSFAYPS